MLQSHRIRLKKTIGICYMYSKWILQYDNHAHTYCCCCDHGQIQDSKMNKRMNATTWNENVWFVDCEFCFCSICFRFGLAVISKIQKYVIIAASDKDHIAFAPLEWSQPSRPFAHDVYLYVCDNARLFKHRTFVCPMADYIDAYMLVVLTLSAFLLDVSILLRILWMCTDIFGLSKSKYRISQSRLKIIWKSMIRLYPL